jgi:predicted nucleic acid-binding protein
MKRIYLDSNVFISVVNVEIGRRTRGLFVEAELFLNIVRKEGHVLLLSKLFFDEVKAHCYFTKEDVFAYFQEKEIKCELAEELDNDFLRSLKKTAVNVSDAIHAETAIKNKCDCIVTFNARHFEKIKGRISVFEPAEFT